MTLREDFYIISGSQISTKTTRSKSIRDKSVQCCLFCFLEKHGWDISALRVFVLIEVHRQWVICTDYNKQAHKWLLLFSPLAHVLSSFPVDESRVHDNFCPQGEWPLCSLIFCFACTRVGKMSFNFHLNKNWTKQTSKATARRHPIVSLLMNSVGKFTEGNAFPPSRLSETHVCISEESFQVQSASVGVYSFLMMWLRWGRHHYYHNNYHYSFSYWYDAEYVQLFLPFSGINLWWHRAKRGLKDISLLSNVFQLLLGNPEAFPGQMTSWV